jgi:glutamate N-acetyltransferase/amino-acid N-acetyltransferase
MQAMGFDRVLGGVCAPQGFLAAGVSCGIKGDGRPDLALLYSERPAMAAGVFTSNEVKAAPVLVTSQRVVKRLVRAAVVNSGNANAMTGSRGMEDALSMARLVEEGLSIPGGQAVVASTGPIGEYLPMDKVRTGIEQAIGELSPGGNTDAAKAIITTDTYPKELALEMEIGGETVRMGAMAKGSGMIHPHLATMIVVITTDISLDPDLMQNWLEQAVEWSFNRISVDGDQSTNDTVLMIANGAALPDGHTLSREESGLFFSALCWLTANLAMALVKDGEGMSRLLRLVVNGAADDRSAVGIARAIANSNLVKCAFSGGMPAWGRVAAAAGSAGVPIDQEMVEIYFGDHLVASRGEPVEHDAAGVAEYLKRDEIEITLNLGMGDGSAYFLTTDLTGEYVELNASSKT